MQHVIHVISLSVWALIAGSLTATAGPVGDAAGAGDAAVLRQVLEAGADADEAGAATPLYFASRDGREEIVALLLEFGADPNELSPWGGPLHAASGKGYAGIVALLLAAGADPNLKGGENNRTALHDAAQSGSIETAKLLIDAGVDVNVRATGRSKGPATHFAARRDRHEMVEFLQANGAQPRQVEPIAPNELAQADLTLGEVRARACTPCHTFTPGKPGERGPSLWNVVGREVASVPDFPYTYPLRNLEGNWDYELLNRFLADNLGFAPGTEMYTGSEPDRKTRIALIAYLRTQADDPVPLP